MQENYIPCSYRSILKMAVLLRIENVLSNLGSLEPIRLSIAVRAICMTSKYNIAIVHFDINSCSIENLECTLPPRSMSAFKTDIVCMI